MGKSDAPPIVYLLFLDIIKLKGKNNLYLLQKLKLYIILLKKI